MKPIQKQTGEIKLNRENAQFGYFLSFARRECSKSTRLHPSRGAKAAKQQNCTLRGARKQEINRIVPFAGGESSKSTGLHPSRAANAAKRQNCTLRGKRKQQNNRIVPFARRECLNNEYYGLFAKDNGLQTIKLTRNQYQVHSNF
jgi:hypothetical protein